MVVTYNSAEVIGDCLDALGGLAKVVVVDNASSDGTVGIARSRAAVQVIENKENVGFAAAVNQGCEAAAAHCTLILNPDARATADLEPLWSAAEAHGFAAGRLADWDGTTQRGFTVRRFPSPFVLILEVLGINRLLPGNPWNRRYRYLDRDPEASGWVEQPAGACLAVRADVWRRVGGFDEEFVPVWFEDVDFAKRAQEAGFPAWYCGEVPFRHLGGHSVARQPETELRLNWYSNLLRYVAKHHRGVEYRLVCLAVLLSLFPRAVAGMMRQRGVAAVQAYRAVGRMTLGRLVSGVREHRKGSPIIQPDPEREA